MPYAPVSRIACIAQAPALLWGRGSYKALRPTNNPEIASAPGLHVSAPEYLEASGAMGRNPTERSNPGHRTDPRGPGRILPPFAWSLDFLYQRHLAMGCRHVARRRSCLPGGRAFLQGILNSGGLLKRPA